MLSWQVGDVTITRVVEIESTGGTRDFWPQATPEEMLKIDWLAPHFIDERGRLKMSFHSLLVQTPDRKIIVDTCFGNDKERDIPAWNNLQTDYLDQITSVGFAREQVDTVICTHLHSDHVGWNTMLIDGKWVPTFPNARYLMAKEEFQYWVTDRKEEIRFGDVLSDSVFPVVEAGLLDQVEQDHQVADEVWLESSNGHTIGHVSVRIRSKGEEALITGDCIHHPFQIAHPDWASTKEYDTDTANATRLRLLRDYSDQPVLVIGTHFASPTAGYMKQGDDGHWLDVVEQN